MLSLLSHVQVVIFIFKNFINILLKELLVTKQDIQHTPSQTYQTIFTKYF